MTKKYGVNTEDEDNEVYDVFKDFISWTEGDEGWNMVTLKEAGTQVRHAVGKNELLYDHTKFNETIEVLIKMIDRLDRFDRMFAIQQ